MVELRDLRRSSRQTTIERPDYQESDSEESNDEYFEFSHYNHGDENDNDEDYEQLPVSNNNRERSSTTSLRPTFISAARDSSSIDLHAVDIPDIYQYQKIEHSPPDIINNNDVDYTNPLSIFMTLFETGVQRCCGKVLLVMMKILQQIYLKCKGMQK